MAIADFGGSALGRPIEFLTADHRNKPNIGAGKFREWADTKWLTMLLGGSNTTPPIAGDRKIPFFRDRGRRRFADRQRLKRVQSTTDTTALGNGTAKTILDQGGKPWSLITADYAFGA